MLFSCLPFHFRRDARSSSCIALFFWKWDGVICRHPFAGRWRWIQKVFPERVDVVPQGAACLWVSRGVALFQPPAGHLHFAGWGLARYEILRPVHKQLVRHFLFPFFYFICNLSVFAEALIPVWQLSGFKTRHFDPWMLLKCNAAFAVFA